MPYCIMSFQRVTKIIVLVCLAHIWIIICAIAYVELEGFTRSTGHPVTVDETELALDVFAEYKHISDITEIKHSRLSRERFRQDYEKKLKMLQYWKVRNEFNDISKSYVFVLLSHTTLGGHGSMYLQTWRSQLFYIFTMPFGVLAYALMIHSISAEVFEVLAFTAVTTFQRTNLNWTVDQRELYEKLKVFVLAFLFMVATVFLFGTIGISTDGNYTEGVYHVINMMLMISWGDRLFSYADYPHQMVATILTILVFTCQLMLYTMLYSIFIMFRYNGCEEMIVILFGESDELDDAGRGNDALQFEEWRQQQQQQQPEELLLLHQQQHQYKQHRKDKNKKQQQQQQEEEKGVEFFHLHSKLDLGEIQKARQQQNEYRKSNCGASSTTSSSSSIQDRQDVTTYTHLEQPFTISTAELFIQPKQKYLTTYSPPDIEVSPPSPQEKLGITYPSQE